MTRAWGILLVVAAAIGVAAARGGGGGGARGGFNRAGPAAGGSFGQGRRSVGTPGGGFSTRGPAAGGTLGDDYGRNVGDVGYDARRVERDAVAQERRQQFGRLGPPDGGNRQDYYDNDNRQNYYDGHDDDHVEHPVAAAVVVGAAIDAAAATVPEYWTAPCEPLTVVVGGTTYYQCDSAWYVRAYSGGDVTYIMVNPPAGY